MSYTSHHATTETYEVSGHIHEVTDTNDNVWVSIGLRKFRKTKKRGLVITDSHDVYVSLETAKNLKAFLNSLDI